MIAVFVASGCRSNKVSIVQARDAYAWGDLEAADTALRELAEGRKQTRQSSELDLAMVELAQGNLAAAESRMRTLRDHFDTLPPNVSVGDAASLAVDDRVRPFQLAGYEQVLLRSMLALCSLAGDATDAEAYCLQAQARQAELDRIAAEEDSATFVQQVALAPYLSGALREATHQNYDDAERAFRLVSNIQPEFAPAVEDIARANRGAHSAAGHGVVYVLALVGHGPRLVETTAPTTTTSLQIASTLLRTLHNHQQDEDDEPVLPNVVSVKVPQVEVPPSDVAAIGVSFGGELLGATQTITDVGQLATEQVQAEMPWTIARAVVRRVLKETSVVATAHSLGLTGDAAAVFTFAAMNAWSATEKADTRCWGLLPREIQVLRAELPVGPQEIQLSPLAFTGQPLGAPQTRRVVIEDGRNHYVVVIAPEQILSVLPSREASSSAEVDLNEPSAHE
ncbi:hypothetical protein Mal15_11780 [Stieleria maiorica]|uniref:Uncharacterized protein n=1 Tax=Stieleria maiorica TaxID=2795974 RepID=A0A5B9MAQ5_9BACT|nr:hypothetical protein [Stieleria maiorica]QEF97140.1 hypothetical protein Mal15_11780 [Stieleria maiorica]